MRNKIEINNLTKYYNKNCALNDFSLKITEPGVVGFFGPNGSGKSTTIKILASLLRDYQGEVLINDLKPGYETKSIVSYLPDRNYLEKGKTVSYAVKLFETFYKDFDKEKALKLLNQFNINLKSKIQSLSKGNQEKVHTILVISREAQIYLFDEPIAGVDPASRELVFKLITDHCNKNAITLLTTHLISDIEDIIDRAIFIQNGKVILNESRSEFKNNEQSLNNRFKEAFRCY